MTPIFQNLPSGEIFNLNKPLPFGVIPGSAGDHMAKLNILVQLILAGNIDKILQDFWCWRVTNDNQP